MPDSRGNLIIDLDGTICPIKGEEESYADLEPFPAVVEAMRRWQRQGFTITIFSSRNMRTHGGNLGLINKHTARPAMDWLDEHQIPYDEILFGKPWPRARGIYVDDRTVRPREFLENSQEAIEDILAADRLSHTAAPLPTEVVITMAGEGSRFLKAGFDRPKFMIKAKGLPLFLWSLLSMSEFIKAGSRFTFIAQKQVRAGDFIREHCRLLGLSRVKVIEIDGLTDGQATTALLARETWEPQAPLAIYNIDTYVEPGLMNPGDAQGQGWIPCFDAPGDHWSFVKLGPDEAAVEVREKQRISDHCTVGLYWFSSCALYERAYQDHYQSGLAIQAKERYVAPLYNQIIQDGGKVHISSIPQEQVHVLGTPEELRAFIK
jgi:capsule biosynthesis phosphatase